MFKLLIDHQTFSMQNYGGISRYFANIQHTVESRENIESKVGILYTPNYYLKDYPAPLNNATGRFFLRKRRKLFKWNQKYSNYLIQQNNFDLLHPSYYNTYFLKNLKKPYVITVHDMIHERLPEYFSPDDEFVQYKRVCVENAAHIIAISEATKKDLQEILNIDGKRITVIHHGYQMNTVLDAEENAIKSIQKNYLLFVGERKGYKNFSVFLTAVAALMHEEKDLTLICAGGGSFQRAEQELISRLKISEKTFQINATDNELKSLYQNARAFIFPSLYEGFGLPILEAFKYNCPVIASDSSCFREIGGNAVSYFDPSDKHHMLTTIKEVINNTDLSQALIKEGKIQLENFSMDLCMDKTLAVYKNISS